MGQRHHAILIGRVRRRDGATRYRCLAAIYDRWCYRTGPLRHANRFRLMAEQPDNASLIREELQDYAESVERQPESPCPLCWRLLGLRTGTVRMS
ncbi:hypothetical protein FA15DRAFT_614223 [Coprinopsis marcescibilis]|uniref:Uncharacterized protein n=1 Tax=Coprinopsis marcescibilis TaxID=230819 RepID=A0A5C3L3S6_COPMA|nr:hypothetical protein FA15DRAFT_614223 [Coprinopsis marcescibilis]